MDLQLQKKFSRERDCISGKQREQENYPPEVQHMMMEKRSMKAKKTSSRRCDDAREREEQNWGLPPTNSGSVGSILGKEMEHEADSAMAERIVLARQHPFQLFCFDRSVLVHVRPAEFCDDFWICIRGK
jgi:hypothetical protein